MYDIGVAVAGTGFIGPVHIEALQRLGVHVRGVLGSSPEKSERTRRQMGLARAYADYEEVLADDTVQAVHLAVPNVLHYDMTCRALEAGKHVMCEKPLAMNTEESADLVARAQASGLAAGVCYNIRFYPINLEARARVEHGDVGDVFSVVGSYVQDWLFYETDYNWRVLADQGGALRAVADIGTHWMDLVSSITGLHIEAICADLRTVHPIRQRPTGEVETFSGKMAARQDLEPVDINTEDCGGIMLRFEGGARGMLWVSQVTAGRKNSVRYEIAGRNNALAWNSEHPNELWIGHRERPNEILLRDPSLMAEQTRRFINYPGGHNEGFPDTFKQCFRAFYDAIASGDPTAAPRYPTFEEGHREVALCEAILLSHQEQHWVDVKV